MHTTDLTTLELLDVWYEQDPAMRVRVNFPFFAATGTESCAVVYFEIEPGLPRHAYRQAEEIVDSHRGDCRGETGRGDGGAVGRAGGAIPAMVPHGIQASETRQRAAWASSPRPK